MTKAEIGLAAVMSIGLVAWAYAQDFSPLFINGQKQVCTTSATECVVLVRIAASTASGGCVASIDPEFVVVKASAPVTFQLAKVDMYDDQRYEFAPRGIKWHQGDAASAAQEFNHRGTQGAKSAWETFSVAASKPWRRYEPRVRQVGLTDTCLPGDPKINNDGP